MGSTTVQPNPNLLGQEYDPSSETWTPDYTPGEISWGDNGKAYQWCRAAEAIGQYDLCVVLPQTDYDAEQSDSANSARNRIAGIAPIDVPAGRWFWLQRVGKTRVKVWGNNIIEDAQIRLNGAVPGRVTSTGGGGNDFVFGLGIIGLPDSTANVTTYIDAQLNWAVVNG